MNIEIESRESIEERANKPFAAHTALISITDMDYDFAKLKNKPEYLLQLKFDDISADVFDELFNRYPAIASAMRNAKDLNLFTDEQAAEIAEFVNSILDRAGVLICQCEYGQSRSAGVAAAVRQFLYKSGIEIFADDLYYPNKLVYRKVLKALDDHKKRRTGNPYYYHVSEEYIKTRFEKVGGDDALIASLSFDGKPDCFRSKEQIEEWLSSKNLLCRSWWQALEGFIGITEPFEFISIKMHSTGCQYNGSGAPITHFSEYKYGVEKISIVFWLGQIMRDMRVQTPRRVPFYHCNATEFDILAKMIWNREKKQITLVPMIICF